MAHINCVPVFQVLTVEGSAERSSSLKIAKFNYKLNHDVNLLVHHHLSMFFSSLDLLLEFGPR